jgi:hypothetical protein
MISVNKGENIVLTLQLIKSDGISVEEDATVSYRIFDTTATIELVSSQSAIYNSITQSYTNSLVPSASWTNQSVGSYLVVWSVSDTTDDFNSVYTEELKIDIANNDIQRILGLVHQNCEIYDTKFDQFGNMKKAKMRIFNDSNKTSILANYQITAVPSGPGKFTTWEQIEI